MAGDTGIDWEQRYRERQTPWEKGAPHPELDRVLRTEADAFGGECARILVPGCGFGHDVKAIAARFPQAQVTGIDIAPSALATATTRTAELANAEILLQNLFEPPESWRGSFDVVFEHTCLSAIDPSLRGDYARVIRQVLRPGGRLVAVFFIDPDLDPGEPGPPYGIERAQLDLLFADGFELLDTRFPIATYPGREQREEWRLYRV